MKIDELIPKQAIQSDSKVQKSEKPEQAFGEMLSQEMQGSAPAAPKQVNEFQGLQAALHAPATAPPKIGDCERFAADLENALDQWADIGELVASPDASAKEIQSRIGSLLDSSRSLQKSFEALPENHPLKQIADELNVFSYVESIKWQRGDYL